jgi:hypothetical protein
VIDYVAKYSPCLPAFGTQTAADAIASVQAPMEHAEWVLGIPLKEDLVDATTGEVHPRCSSPSTRHRSPQTTR